MKKHLHRLLTACLLALVFCLGAGVSAVAAEPIDSIEYYAVYLQPNPDGTVNMNYEIAWRVLDDKEYGPLEWVTVGCANDQIANLQPLTDNIDSVRYTGDGGDYIRVDFDKAYYAGETVAFSYCFTQDYLYTILEDGSIQYTFTPGWFDEAPIKQLELYFADPVTPDRWYKADYADLAPGQRVSETVAYPASYFTAGVDPEHQADNRPDDSGDDSTEDIGLRDMVVLLSICALVGLFCLVLGWFACIFIRLCSLLWGAVWYGAFGHPRPKNQGVGVYKATKRKGVPTPDPWDPFDHPAHYVFMGVPHSHAPGGGAFSMGGGSTHGGGAGRSSGGSGCACASSCACACACAGGGRAGCSVKNTYAVRLPENALQKKSK